MRSNRLQNLAVVLVSALVVTGCMSGSQSSYSGPTIGSACDPAVQAEGCSGTTRIRCEGVWTTTEVCAAGQYCTVLAAAGGGVVSQCVGTPIGPGTTGEGADAVAEQGVDSGSTPDTSVGTGADVAAPEDTGENPPPAPDASANDTAAAPAFAASGVVQGTVANQKFALDYENRPADIALMHRLDTEGPSCAPVMSIGVQQADGTCRLQLEFALGNQAGVLDLVAAEFHAVAQDGQGQPLPCAGWPAEAGVPAVYKRVAGSATVAMPVVPQPQAGAADATLTGLILQPSGSVTMQLGTRKWTLDLGQLQFGGTAQSVGSTDPSVVCSKPKPPVTYPMPQYKLTDVNPKSATYKQQVSLQDFAGKRIAVLLGAGWCASCVAQAEGMQKLKAQLGPDTVLLVLHEKNSAGNVGTIAKNLTIPVLQGTNAMDAWALHGGKKNDGFFYGADGKKLGYFQGAGTIYTNIWEQWLSTTNQAAANGTGYNCSNGGAPGQFGKACAAAP